MRILDNYYSNCTLNEANKQTSISYKCVIEAPTANKKKIKFGEFNAKNGKKLVGFTPIAKMYFENLIEVNHKYSASNLYL